MVRFWRHFTVLLLVYVVIGVVVAYLGATIPPYVGDLTRLGGYSERDFGWREPQQRFNPPLYHPDTLDGGADVLILGDSMSLHRPGEQTDPGSYWPNELARATGWRIEAMHRNEHTVAEILDDPRYRANPPRAFVFEFPERGIVTLDRVTAEYQDCSGADDGPVTVPPLAVQAQGTASEALAPVPPATHGVDFSLGAHHLQRRVVDWLLPWRRQVVRFKLHRSGLFSSVRSDELLVFADDLLKIGLPEARLHAMGCALRALQSQVEADGRTHFVVLMVPDKLTTYRDVVRGLDPAYPDVFAALSRDPDLHLPRVDLDFRAAVARGERDLFLPNDTHPGFDGHRLLSARTLEFLISLGVAARTSATCPDGAATVCDSTLTIASRP
jgi:hypothetical protein